jgi:hypothetical protein
LSGTPGLAQEVTPFPPFAIKKILEKVEIGERVSGVEKTEKI